MLVITCQEENIWFAIGMKADEVDAENPAIQLLPNHKLHHFEGDSRRGSDLRIHTNDVQALSAASSSLQRRHQGRFRDRLAHGRRSSALRSLP
ncbi:hypothetical protein [Streptomyces cavernae]|uniref:hypothetical protein n=1 Tax=Streptomyces cavernae TaxID=2259034 RepID=UPI000FEBCBB6|nr:hypothetical protein [Streptomyces cavernae]